MSLVGPSSARAARYGIRLRAGGCAKPLTAPCPSFWSDQRQRGKRRADEHACPCSTDGSSIGMMCAGGGHRGASISSAARRGTLSGQPGEHHRPGARQGDELVEDKLDRAVAADERQQAIGAPPIGRERREAVRSHLSPKPVVARLAETPARRPTQARGEGPSTLPPLCCMSRRAASRTEARDWCTRMGIAVTAIQFEPAS